MSDHRQTEVILTVRELDPSQLKGIQQHSSLCHGEAPGPGGETMRFHLGIAQSGERIYLFREGKLPQELRVNELVGDWLDALKERERRTVRATTSEETSDAQTNNEEVPQP